MGARRNGQNGAWLAFAAALHGGAAHAQAQAAGEVGAGDESPARDPEPEDPAQTVDPASPPQALPPSLPSVPSDAPAEPHFSEGYLALSAQLDALLPEAVADLDVRADYIAKASPFAIDEATLLGRAKQGWAIAPQLLDRSGSLLLRISVAHAKSRTLRVRAEPVTRETLEVRTMSMMRELLLPASDHPGRIPQSRAPKAPVQPPSEGRAVLAVTGALTGAYVGVAVENLGGSADAALVYPLMSLGAGVGVAASFMIAEEWNVNFPEAWTLSASAFWPTVAALTLADARGIAESSDRYVFGLAGTGSGLLLGTLLVSLTHVTDGDAILIHSGALFGTLYGGLVEGLWTGEPGRVPALGMGAGMASGFAIGGLLGTTAELSGSDVLFIGLGGTLGAMGGAALGTPWLLGSNVTANERRYWLGATLASSLAGGAISYFLLPEDSAQPQITPYFGEVHFSQPELPAGWVFGLKTAF